MNSRATTVVSAAMVLLGTVASAQTPAKQPGLLAERYIDTEVGLTLAEAIEDALEREPSLRASRAELDAARGMRQQAAARANPTLMLERREEPAGSDNQTMVQFSVPLELFRRSARIAVAERELEVADRFVGDRTRILVNDVKMQYGQAAAAAREVAVADDLLVAVRRDLELVRRRVEEGGAPPLDRDRLAVEVHRLDAARVMAAGRAETAMIELKRLLNLSGDSPVKLRETIEVLAPSRPAAAAGNLQERADVREAEARVRLSDARISQAQAEGRLDLTLFGGYMRMDAGFMQRGVGAGGELEPIRGLFHNASAGAMVMLPLWNRNSGAVAAARAMHTADAARLEAVQLSATAEVTSAAVRAEFMTKALAAMADAAVLARRNLVVVRQTYELGRATLPEVLAEQRRYLEFEGEYTSALRDAFDARVALEFARGDLK